jgi:hypothetical protein
MYDSFETFRDHALSCGRAYYPDSSLEPQKIAVAHAIYQRAKQGTKLHDVDNRVIDFGVTIVGRLALKIKDATTQGKQEYRWLPSDESFPSIDEIMKQNLRVLDEDAPEPGSILTTANWSLLANDAWLLGGLHAETEFHFASPLSWKNLWDEEAKRMTVTAREAIGVAMHGYQLQRPHRKLEAVAVCVDQQRAQAASLLSYRDSVQTTSSRPALQAFFATLPRAVTQY